MGIIESHREKAADLRRQLELLEAELRGMEMYEAEQVGRSPSPPRIIAAQIAVSPRPDRRVGGKQPGQLSRVWRSVLEKFYATNALFSADDAATVHSATTGRVVRGRELRRRLQEYEAEHAFVEADANGSFRVTETAAKRFGFQRHQGISEAVGEPLEEATASLLFANQEGGDGHGPATT